MIFFDFEVFRYDWLVVIYEYGNNIPRIIVNNPAELKQYYEENKENIWIGYNSRGYDQYILKAILLDFDPYQVNEWIIQMQKPGWSFSNLFNKIPFNSYDVMTSMHGLKQLEGFMGNDIRETTVPFYIQRKLSDREMFEVIKYCKHDVQQTIEVFINRKEEFESHMSLIKAFKLPLKYINKTKAQLAAIILNASRVHGRNDEFNITIPDTLRVGPKYQYIVDWYKNELNRDYEKSLETEVAGVPHIFAWGGLHGAIENYHGEGIFINIDVASYYPSLMIEYGFSSRSIADSKKYEEIYHERLRLKKEKNPMQQPYKIVLNGTYGAMKDKYNNLYDPLQANNVCVSGQLMLLDLIEKLENYCQIIQSNTDGLFIKINSMDELERIKGICKEWEDRTRMKLEFDTFVKIFQKDVNNYITIHEDGSYKSKGSYVKKLETLDYDLPIVNKALINYFVNGASIEDTIMNCNDLIEFQRVVKVSSKYLYAMYGDEKLSEKVLRVFASRSRHDKGVFKVKDEKKNPEKIANTPERCFIENGNIKGVEVPRKLDKTWYIETAKKRLNDFIKQG